VKGFVRENREALGTDIELLASLLERIDNQKDNLGLVIQKGSTALSNLAIAFEPGTGTYGSRIQVLPDITYLLCETLARPPVNAPPAVCNALKTLLKPLLPAASADAASAKAPEETAEAPTGPETIPEVVPQDLKDGLPSLFDLLGGDRE
jgi:phospholipid/cholesterol/gamma-HCH transport system substrate-binding protein